MPSAASVIAASPGWPLKTCLVDASAFFFRSYFAIPPERKVSAQGFSTAALWGFSRFFLTLLKEMAPDRVAVCFDESLGTCFRNEIYADYKSNRALPDEDLIQQLRACVAFVRCFGIRTFASDTLEADDLLGSLFGTVTSRPEALAVALATTDKDLGQLLRRPQDCLLDCRRPPGEAQPVWICRDRNHWVEQFGVEPEQFVDYLALVGDTVDCIPGVPGIGPKTAVKLLQLYKSCDQIFQGLPELPSSGIRGARGLAERLADHQSQVQVAKQLAALKTDTPLIQHPDDLLWSPNHVNLQELVALSEEMGLGRLPLDGLLE